MMKRTICLLIVALAPLAAAAETGWTFAAEDAESGDEQ